MSNKPLVIINVEATVKEKPQLKTITTEKGEKIELYRTYVEVHTDYRPFYTDVYTKEEPNVDVGEMIDVQISTTDYKVRLPKQRTDD